ncbi:MAG: hypothetical protein U1A78_10385 [Polyangia bacterium]
MKTRRPVGRAGTSALGSFTLFALLVGGPAPGYAAECAVPTGAASALGEHDAAARLRFVRDVLRETAVKERRFLVGWALTYAGFAGGAWVLVPFSDDPRKPVDAIWSSSTAVAGGILAVIPPAQVLRDHRQVERLAASPGPPSCEALREAERRLEHAANSELGAGSALGHISSFAINIALGLVLGYGLKRPDTAATNTLIGIFISELMIATRPLAAARGLEKYRAGALTEPTAVTAPPRLTLAPALAPLDGGLSVSLVGAF